MRKTGVIAIALSVGLGTASLALAAQQTRSTRGWISAVDTNANTLKVKGKDDVVTFKLENNAKFIDQGKAVTLAQLKPGEHVMIRYTGLGLNREATEVDVLAANHAPAKMPATHK